MRGTRGDLIRKLVLLRFPLCVACERRGVVSAATEVDHIVPLFKGGADSLDPFENRQALCRRCHQEKTDQDMGHVGKRRIGLDGWPCGFENTPGGYVETNCG